MSNAGATTITVNTSLFAAGDTLFITNIGAGASTITAGTATVSTASSLVLAQYDSGRLYFTSTGVAIWEKYQGASTAAAFSGASVYKSGTQSITRGTTTILTFDSENFDTGSYHDTGSNTSRLTTASTGKYLFNWTISTPAPDVPFYLVMYKNGVAITLGTNSGIVASIPFTSANTAYGFTGAFLLAATAADYYEIGLLINGAGSVTLTNAVFSIISLGA
jgi:hypothetical protein